MIVNRHGVSVLVISDEPDLGGLIALNLRLRGLLVEQTDLSLVQSERWAPAFGRPNLVILHLESPDRVSSAQVQRLMGRPWAIDVPVLLAAEKAAAIASILQMPPGSVLPHPSDVGKIVARARRVLGVES